MATSKESAESRGTMIFTEKSSGSFIASCSFSQTLQRQRLSSSSRSNGKRVSLQSSDSRLSQIVLLIEKDLFSMSAASPHDPFSSLANNRISVVKEYFICIDFHTALGFATIEFNNIEFNSSRCSAVK